jgi:hypothetical protein
MTTVTMPSRRAAMRYEPPSTVEPQDCIAGPSAGRCSCGQCGKVFAAAAIITVDSSIQWRDHECCFSVDRRLYCDHCDHLVAWTESCRLEFAGACSRSVIPTGIVLMGPGYIRAVSQVRRFLATYPQAAGVSQSA